MNPDEQSTDTAALIRKFFRQAGDSNNDEFVHLSETAEKLRQDLSTQPSSKDTFRHGGGFERVLEVLRNVNLRLSSPQDGGDKPAACHQLLRSLLQLLSEALRQHHGNERYFSNHLDGWQSLQESLRKIQVSLCSIVDLEAKARELARLYDIILAFALDRNDFSELSSELVASGEQLNGVTASPASSSAPSVPFHIKHPEAFSAAIRLALQTFESAGVGDEGRAVYKLLPALLKITLVATSHNTRNASALWHTGILSDILSNAYSTALPDSLRSSLQGTLLSIGRHGLNTLDDVATLFRKAHESEHARANLLRMLQSSKQPAFIQFDLEPCGFSSIELPSLRSNFPSSIGYALTAWVRIDEFDANSHTTLFGAFDPSHTCFVLMYLEKDSHQLILQTSVRSPNPSVRFKSTCFEAGVWYHIAIVQRKSSSDPTQSVSSLFVNGDFAEQRKCNYPEMPDEPASSASNQRRARTVQAFFGTGVGVAANPVPHRVHTRWSLASAHLYSVPLTDEFVAVHYRLGPRYRGNLQDCLGPLLTYRASSELNRYNETLHPEKTDKSDIVLATEGRGSDVVPENRLLLGICPTAVVELDAASKPQSSKYELDNQALQKWNRLRQKTRHIALNTAVPSINEAIKHSYGAGVMTGDPIVVVPQSLDDATWCLSGSLPMMMQLLETANTKHAFLQASEIFFECIKDNWRISEAMEKGQGFGILSTIIREKLGLDLGHMHGNARKASSMLSLEDRQTLPQALLELVLDFVGYDRLMPENSMLVNPMAYRVLLIDFDTWRRCDIATQKLYYAQFVQFVSGNRNAAFNQRRLSRMRVTKRLIEALKSEDVSEEAAGMMIESLRALIDSNASSHSYRDLAMYVAWGLHDARAMPTTTTRSFTSFASTVALRQKVGSWPRSQGNSRPSTPGGAGQPSTLGLSRFELAIMVLKLLAETVEDDRTVAIRRFTKAVSPRWLLHLLAESDARVVELTLGIICKAMNSLGPEFKAPFIDKNGGFITLKHRLKPFWKSPAVWTMTFAIFFGRNFPSIWLDQEFSAFHLVEILGVNDSLHIQNPETLPAIFSMLEAGLRKIAGDDPPAEAETRILKNVIQFLGELYDRSGAFRDFAVNSRYLQELLFVLFPLLAGTDRLSAETELQTEALSFNGEVVKMRPHSNSLGERPPSVRSLDMSSGKSGKRTPSPMAANRVAAPKRISSFILVNDRLSATPAQFKAPMAPEAKEPVKINIANSLVESLLELCISLFIDQICYKDKFSGIGLFLKVPPGFKEHQAYFESYVLVHALAQLGALLRLNQHLLVETRVLTNLARYAQHMAEAVSEGWFIDGAQPLLDFTGEVLDHLQQPDIASLKAVRLCSQSTNAIRVVFLKATLWRLAELNEDAAEANVGNFLDKMTYWQTILFSPENQETLFIKLICYLLYHKLCSGVHSVRLAAARLWRMVLVQKPTETATMLTNTMGPDQRHLSTGFMKLIGMDDDDFLAWVDGNRDILDTVFHTSLSKPWEDFVQNENRSSDETAKMRLSKRKEKLRQWQTEESTADDFIHRYEISTNHWRSNVHAQERVKLQRAQQDHQEVVNNLFIALAKVDKQIRQPCGLVPDSVAKWQLDETEAANRMRMRLLPDTSELKETNYMPKRKASQRTRKDTKLAVNTSVPRVVSDDMASIPPTPGSPALMTLDGTGEVTEGNRGRSDSVSNSQLLEGGFEMVDDPQMDEDGILEDKNRKVMTSLQRGDMVQQLYNISRIVGLEACEGLLVVGQKCLYMQDNFFQRSDGEIVSVSQAPEDERDPYVQLISGKDVGATRTKHSIGDQETRHWTWLEVLSVSKRRFLLRDVAIEVFFTDGRSYLITCMSSKVRDDLHSAIVGRAPQVHSTSNVASEDAWRLDTLRNPDDIPKNLGSKFNSLFNNGPTHTATKKWQRGEMSNFQYLMLVNTMAGRTFNDLTQYPVFPWVLADYTSEELDLENSKTFRDFSKPMGCQTPAREAEFKDRFKQFAEMGDDNAPPFHYGTHYSSAMIVSSYLIRLQPFVQSYLLLQGGAFDHADRLFDSIERAWLSASKETMSDVRELTPEFFYLPEFLTNINKYDFGTKQVTGETVSDVKLPRWAKGDPQIFIQKHREALESPYVSQRLPDWIDLVFGYKQRGEAAVEATNVFNHLSYAGAKDLDKIDNKVEHIATIGIIHSFGQTPHQVFQKPHAYRELERQAEPKLDMLAESLVRLPDPEMTIAEKVSDFTFAPWQGRLLASGPGTLNVLPDCTRILRWGFSDHSIRFFSSHSKRALGLYENTHVGPITAATFADSKTLVTGGQDCTIGLWKVTPSRDLIEITPKTYLFGHRTAVAVLAASRVFSTLLSASADGQVILWGLNRFDCIRVLLPAGRPPVQAARLSNVSGHIILCRGANILLYTLNGHLLVEQKLCDREEEEILCCAFYEGAGTNIWALTNLSDGSWYLQLVKRLHHNEHMDGTHEGESGRSGFQISHFFKVVARSSSRVSMAVNLLWPFVIIAIVLNFITNAPLWIFATAYIGMVPAANLLGFAGQAFARKMPKVAGILIETTFGSIVEIILFIVLIVKHEPDDGEGEGNGDEGNLIPIIQAAILGSILTNLLLCLGLCFFAAGIRKHKENQKFHAVVSEVGSGLLLVAAFGLLIPSAFYSALKSETISVLHEHFTKGQLQQDILRISQATSIALIVAYILYVIYSCTSAHSIFDEVIEMDEHRDADRADDMAKPKLTMTETVVAIIVSIVFVALLLVILVEQIEDVVESGVPDQFLGLILLPLVEKAAEHLTAIDEAWDGVINVALYHCIGPSIQTALFNAPLVVLVGWALGKPMDLNFEIFMIALLVLSILVVGNFLRDQESNWLEGALLVIVYIIIAIASFYYPNPDVATSNGLEGVVSQNVTISAELYKQLLALPIA
ncbi:Beige protein-like 1 [Pseudocercospora fuligena]|uniref:Beige protein-like 1 n=1 Tax=Pseudocercospora fuligena TaxID=685502 RepID=A0A8H6RS78_9PEZI|nr:Beige protein-like 1 [Pseudocercospora fuligena]